VGAIMMTKETFLNDVRSAALQRLVSVQELTETFNGVLISQPLMSSSHKERSLGITEILYFIGGAIVFLGIVVLLSQHWGTLSFFTKLLATLGSGCAAYYVGLLMIRQDRFSGVAQAFFLIAALVLPMGLSILFDHNGYPINRVGVQVLISGILSGFFLASYAIFDINVFLVFSVLYVSWFFHSGMQMLIVDQPNLHSLKITEYRFLTNGLAYILLGHAFSGHSERRALSGSLYCFGVLFFLSAAYALCGWKPSPNYFWEAAFPGLVLAVFFLSVYLKSKSFLTFGALFMIAYIGKITVEYFENSLGWPLSLVLIGFALMGVGYVTFRLNVTYFKTASKEKSNG
jgi:hypothetical protein